jgi:hypothetical protein
MPRSDQDNTKHIDALIACAESLGEHAAAASLREMKKENIRRHKLMERIVTAFTPPPGRHRPPNLEDETERRDILMLVETIEHIRATNERSFYFDKKTHDLRKAIRDIHHLLPGRIALAERELAEARRRGENSDLDHVLQLLRDLQIAIAPFVPWVERRFDPRSAKWHGAARALARHVRIILGRQGIKPGFINEASPGVEIVRRLLVEAGIRVEIPTIVEVLYDTERGGKKI